ncbi:ABC transporter ATP-binding protein [Bradyrhizobium sp. SSBR45G]|uniref:ABC transporter ATP-binding protein n=1 Tax=unclassified Bradyrhizobium TaxID=2631580 RepID=UPI002342B205|nr:MULTISPECIES: ABC transporter ATP-binding protein [unclassified Bradyrhizobium]GLH77265.1 ABC transporter ATP-binding protein [Bradyrhizobium sp. SSBR45G]GLH84023.1 ABC transporter ATP-binding protein [Bradyrhizobium sp. SSBR45R]
MLEIRDLRAGYGGTEVLRGVSLDVNAGEVVAVLGSNGVGKTTLNKVLSGVVPATSGTIRFNGAALERAAAPEIVTAGLIHVPEGRKIFPNLSVRENLELGAYCRPRRGRAEKIEQVYATFPKLKQRARQYAGTLSGGEQQMLAIGRGLMSEPKLLILDEPSLGLSPLMVEEMFALIARLAASGLAIMLVEQNVVQSLELAGRAYIMENGLITLSGPAHELKSNAELKRAYLGL